MPPTPSLRRAVRSAGPLLSLLAVLFTARSSLADHYTVPTGSMLPTVEPGDHVVVDKTAYALRLPLTHVELARLGEPARGDVVVLDEPGGGTVLLKRVVAVAGDEVRVEDGELWLNGCPVPTESVGPFEAFERLGAQHHIRLEHGGGPDFGPTVVPAGQVLVLGDNRGDSRDGRFFGFVPRESLLGRAERVVVRGGSPVWLEL